MEKNIKSAVEEYQCPGCLHGSDVSCFEKNGFGGAGCGKHIAGTIIPPIGKIFIGLPNGFNRLGSFNDMKPNIYEKFEDSDWTYDMWNIPTWKHLNEYGHTLVRGISPRTNAQFLHIFLEDCLDKIDCLNITQEDIDGMD